MATLALSMMAVCCSSVIATGFSWLYPWRPTNRRGTLQQISFWIDILLFLTNLMARISDHAAFFWERLERMAGNEPGGLDIVTLEHLQ